MFNFTLRLRNTLFALLVAGAATSPSATQSQMQARAYQDDRTFRTAAPELAVDDLLTTSAAVTSTLAAAAILRVTFSTLVQPGQEGVLIIKSSASLATVLGGMALHTYSTKSANPDNPIQSMPMSTSSLVQVTVAPNDLTAQQVKFTATQAFDQVELAVGSLLHTNYSVDV